MLLNNNTNKVIELLDYFDNLTNIDKLRLIIHLLENKQFSINYNTDNMINILKEVLGTLDKKYTKAITNFTKYKHLLLFSAKYLELTEKEKKNLSIEMMYYIYDTDYEDTNINNKINNDLLVYDYIYSILN